MISFGDMILQQNADGSFQLSKSQIVWKFSKVQLESEIAKLQTDLAEKQELLTIINSWGA